MAEQISEEGRKARAAYQREWRKKNPDKVRASSQRYWERKARKMAEEMAKEKEGGKE